jgi:transketolase
MRTAFIKKLHELAKKDERIALLTADLGFSVVEDFAKDFPKIFYNMGVSEQNMLGVATALAKDGFLPFVYSIAPFVALRPYEFIKNGPVLHNLPVRFVAIGAGFEYGNLGSTHHLIEDIALMRAQPNITFVAPVDSNHASCALEETYNNNSPVYYRIGKNDKTRIEGINSFETNSVQLIKNSGEILILSIGSIAHEAQEAVNILESQNKEISFGIVPTFSQELTKNLSHLLKKYKAVITIEAHYLNGGLGSFIAEIIAENNIGCQLKRLAIRKLSDGIYGSEHFMHKKNKISCYDIVNSVNEIDNQAK